jgi:hypothetical protein
MSALPPKADIVQHGGNVRFVPKADSCTAAKRCYSITSSACVTLTETKRLRRLDVDDEIEFRGLQDRKIRSAGLSPQRIGTETLVSAAWVTAAPLRYANNVATNPQAAANISQSPATARLSVAWIK